MLACLRAWQLEVLEALVPLLDAGTPARKAELDDEQWGRVKGLGLLSAKPVIYAANVADGDLAEGNEMVERVRELATAEGASTVVVSAQVRLAHSLREESPCRDRACRGPPTLPRMTHLVALPSRSRLSSWISTTKSVQTSSKR